MGGRHSCAMAYWRCWLDASVGDRIFFSQHKLSRLGHGTYLAQFLPNKAGRQSETVGVDRFRSNRTAAMLGQQVSAAALESGTYREKLGHLVEASRYKHLTEREAAQMYGEVMAKLLTLQRVVREWVEARKRQKEHEKVTYRDAWEYSSYQKPDRRAQRLRTLQRHQNGWRAPLNVAYAQLGSSSSVPLSLTQSVHTSLGKYPAQVHSETTRTQAALTRPCRRGIGVGTEEESPRVWRVARAWRVARMRR